jgi:hypothetical protein
MPHPTPEFCDFVAGAKHYGIFGAFFVAAHEHYYSSFKHSTF